MDNHSKKKKAAITATAWKNINSTLRKLTNNGLNAIECFETMVSSGWQGIKVSYFQREIDALKPKKQLKYTPKEDRQAEYEKITARELAAEKRKKDEIEASKKFKDIVNQAKTNIGYLESKKKAMEEIAKLGISPNEYYGNILKIKKN